MDIKGLIKRRWPLFLLALIPVTAGVLLRVLLAGPCPGGMSLVSGGNTAYCIDTYEEAPHEGSYVSRAGLQIATLGPTWYQARAICKQKGGWLCTSRQWEDACDGKVGPGGWRYPYGDTYKNKVCNIPPGADSIDEVPAFEVHQWYQPTLSGALPGCVSRFGVYDMSGNYFEWTDPGQKGAGGAAVTDKRGGAFYSGGAKANSCSNGFTGHSPTFRGSITFRCCAKPWRQDYFFLK